LIKIVFEILIFVLYPNPDHPRSFHASNNDGIWLKP